MARLPVRLLLTAPAIVALATVLAACGGAVHGDHVATEQGQLYVTSLTSSAAQMDHAKVASVCANAASTLASGSQDEQIDWRMISPVCTEATSARTRVAWTEVLVHARNLVDN